MKKSIIFCQAPLKIASVLDTYEKENIAGSQVTIVVRNAKSMFDFIIQLGIKARVVFFENHSSSPIYFLKTKKKVWQDIQSIGIKEGDKVKVYITDLNDDYMQGVYLSFLKQYPTFFLQSKMEVSKANDRNSYCVKETVPLKKYVLSKLYSFLYGYRFKFVKIDHWTFSLDGTYYNYRLIESCNISRIVEKYSFNFPSNAKDSVLLFTEPYRNKFQTEEDYDKLNIELVENLHNLGYSVGVKGHPRIGCHDAVKKLADFEIPSYYPSEFVDMSKFSFVIGFVSSALCTVPNSVKSISILPLCTVQDTDEATYWYNYLDKLSDGMVQYLHSWNELKELRNK